MDIRDTPEQAELRRTARRLARELGPRTVTDLDDRKRSERLAEAVRDAGWLELRQTGATAIRSPAGSRRPSSPTRWARPSPTFRSRARSSPRISPAVRASRPIDGAVVAFSPDLIDAAVVSGPDDGHADPRRRPCRAGSRRGVRPGPRRRRLPPRAGDGRGARATAPTSRARSARFRPARPCARSRPVAAPHARRSRRVGGARPGAHERRPGRAHARACSTSRSPTRKERKQYGVAIGTFQAVQHLLAEARCLIEGALSAALYPAWAVDQLAPDEARAAGRVAKAYCARAARTVCETAVQVHGGIGNTWDCIVHVYLRRALLSSPVVRRRRRAAAPARAHPSGGGRRTFVTHRRKRRSGRGCAPGSPSTTRVCRSRRPTTSTGPARRSGTPRSTTRASSGSPGPPASAVTICPRCSTSSSTTSSPPPARRRARASDTSCRGSRRTPARRSSSASCPA